MSKISELYANIVKTRIPLHYWLVKRDGNIAASIDNLRSTDELINIFDYIDEFKGAEEQWDALQAIDSGDTNDYLFMIYQKNGWDAVATLIQDRRIEVVFNDEDTFLEQFREWEQMYDRESEDDVKTLIVRRLNRERIGRKKAMFSPTAVVESGSKFSFPVDADVLPDIFRDIKTSLEVPYVQYNNGTRIFKIFRGHSDIVAPSYSNALPDVQFPGDNTIFLYTWTGAKPENISMLQSANKSDFDVSSIEYVNGKINFTIASSAYPDVMIDRIYTALNSNLPRPDATLTTPIVTTVTYFNVNFNPYLFSHAIFNDPMISNLLIIPESKRLQESPVIVFKENPSVTVKIVPDIRVFEVKTFRGNYIKPASSHVATATITANSKQQTNAFIVLLSSILARYMDIRPEIIESISRFIPSVSRDVNVDIDYPPTLINGMYDTGYEEKVQQRSKKLSLNQKVAPELFVSGYARLAQRNKQPIAIGENEVIAWRNKRINGEIRQVIKFPLESDLVNPEVNNPRQNYYVCPDDSYPYFERVENTLSNKDVFKYYIQCSNKPSVMPVMSSSAVVSKNTFLETFKIAAPGQLGMTDGRESELIGHNMVRRGTFLSPNSVILSLISARQPHINDLDPIMAERFATNIRHTLFDKIHPEIVLQEQFDLSIDEIRADLMSDSFFDPERWYRALEQRFKLNIYVFWKEQSDRDRGLPSRLLIPQHKGQYVHHHNDRWKSVFILRHYGTEMNRLTTPQCELLIARDGTGLFDRGLGEAMAYASQSLSWEVDDTLNILFRENMFSIIQYDKIFSPITAQHIDQDGKLRMIEVDGKYYVHTLPSRPLNLPMITTIELPSEEFVVSLFGPGSGVGGNWYSIGDIKDAIFVPYNGTDGSTMEDLRRTKKNADLLIQIVMYLRSVFQGTDGEFLRYILTDADYKTAIEDSSILIRGEGVGGQYDINVPRILPEGSIDTIISALSETTNMFSSGKLIIRTPKVLASILWNLRVGTPGNRILTDYYSVPRDYTHQPRVEDVLFGVQSFDRWRVFNGAGNQKTESMQRHVQTILAKVSQAEMYVYTEDGMYYIIQGTASGSRELAVQIAFKWAVERMNPASEAKPGLEPPTNVYGLSNIGTLKLKHRAAEQPSVSILEHESGYSAILPL